MIQIIPAVLATTAEQYQADVAKLKSSQSLLDSWVHIDLADNIFVQNLTIKPDVVQKFPTNFRKEAHLMIIHPKDWIDELVQAGFERIIFHLESQDNTLEVIEYIKSQGLEIGLAINPETPVEKLEQFVDKIDIVLIMTVVPGFQGQSFVPEALNKVRQMKSKNWAVKIGVDGAVKDNNIWEIVHAGADFVIVGSYLLKGDIDENLENLWVEMSR